MISLEEKLKNFPKVYCTNLLENRDRKQFMLSQFSKYGIDGNIFTTEKYDNIKQHINLTVREQIVDRILEYGIPSTITFLRMMKHWYETTNQEYAVFCEDDISFKSIENWNFTWDEFISKFPSHWDAIQIIRIDDSIQQLLGTDSKVVRPKVLMGRWFGVSGIFRRKYVERILSHYVRGNTFVISIPHPQFTEEIIENVMYLMPDSAVYNFPLVYEEDQMFKSTYAAYDPDFDNKRMHQTVSNKYWRDFWNHQSSLSLTTDYMWD